jgi:hypothetical protein
LARHADRFGKGAFGVQDELERRNQGNQVARAIGQWQSQCIPAHVPHPVVMARFVQQHRIRHVQAHGIEAFSAIQRVKWSGAKARLNAAGRR